MTKTVKFSDQITIYKYNYNQVEIIYYKQFIKEIVLDIIDKIFETHSFSKTTLLEINNFTNSEPEEIITIKKQPKIFSINNIIKCSF